MADTRNDARPVSEGVAVYSCSTKEDSIHTIEDKLAADKEAVTCSRAVESSKNLDMSPPVEAGGSPTQKAATAKSSESKEIPRPMVVMKVDPPENETPDQVQNCDNEVKTCSSSSGGAGSSGTELDRTSMNSSDNKSLSRPSSVMKDDPPSCSSPARDQESSEQDAAKHQTPRPRIFPPTRTGNPILSSSHWNPTFGSNSFGSKLSSFGWGSTAPSGLATSPKPLLLRPSQLAVGNSESQQGAARCVFPADSCAAKNPFAKVFSSPEKLETSQVNQTQGLELRPASDNSETPSDSGKLNFGNSKDKAKEFPTSSSLSGPGKRLTMPKFIPLGSLATHKDDSSSSSTGTASVSSSVTGFVFGEKLHERVAEAVTLEGSQSSSKAADTVGTSNSAISSATTNGTSEMLFTSVIQKDQPNLDSMASDSSERPSKSLSEAAREYEEARAVKRKYEEVTVVTGEEGEVNVLQINCKLFAFDNASSSWVERGRGTLRLNDKDGPGGNQSRVVIRTAGNLRVVLNTKIWAGMVVGKPSPKSVRLTAMDNTGQIKVFLIVASPKETDQLHQALQCRIANQRAASAGVSVDGDLSSRSLPPEPTLKKRPSEVQDTGGGDASQM